MFSISSTTVVIMQDCSSMPDSSSRLACNIERHVVRAGMVFVFAFIGVHFCPFESFFLLNKRAGGRFR